MFVPIVQMDFIPVTDEEFVRFDEKSRIVNITIQNEAISLGKFRFYTQVEQSLFQMKEMGFKETQLKEIISIFTDTDVRLVLVTFLVALFHVIWIFS